MGIIANNVKAVAVTAVAIGVVERYRPLRILAAVGFVSFFAIPAVVIAHMATIDPHQQQIDSFRIDLENKYFGHHCFGTSETHEECFSKNPNLRNQINQFLADYRRELEARR